MRAFALAGTATAALFALACGTTAAYADCGGGCYRKVNIPPTYATVSEQVLLHPGRVIARRIPAEYAQVTERVLVSPPRAVPYTTPPVIATVAEQVMVTPPGREWRVSLDAYGNEVGCWVTTSPVYTTEYRNVVVQPATTQVATIPAVFRDVSRTQLVRPPSVEREVVPPVFGVRSRAVLVSPGASTWQPIGY